MTHEEAVAKALKFLRLAKSDNPNEAALAASRAQDIIDRHKLDVGALEAPTPEQRPSEPIKDFEDPLHAGGAKRSTWLVRLTVVVCGANACQCYTQGGTIKIVGRPSDAQTVRYLFALLHAAIDRLAERDARGNGRTWANNYRLGVVETVAARLAEQRKATRQEAQVAAFQTGGESAIVRVNQAIVKMDADSAATAAWVKANLKLRTVPVRASYDHGAREAGRRAGHEIALGGAKAGLGAGHKSLGEG